MTYTIYNEQTGRSFETISMFEVSLEAVWRSVKYLFKSGTPIVITDSTGRSKRFGQRNRNQGGFHS